PSLDACTLSLLPLHSFPHDALPISPMGAAMKVPTSIKIALHALEQNRLRSGLTALGIIIGVGAVIAMVGIGNGAKAQDADDDARSEEHTSELQSLAYLVCRLLLEKK